jgi:two-component system cell cycle response regulator DivK
VIERRRPRHPPLRPLVLLVDGHDDTRELYATALQSLGFEIATVGDGADAYARAWQMHPDVIVTEVWLPQLDGWELISEIRRDRRTRDIPIVIVTADGHPVARERAQRDGCAAFLVKPCVPDDLAAELREVLNRQPLHDDPTAAC